MDTDLIVKRGHGKSGRGAQIALVVVAALIAAAASGVLWGLVTKVTNHEIGIAAVVVGLIVGAVVARVGRGVEGVHLQVIAAAGALIGIGTGKYLAIVWINSNGLFSSVAWNFFTSSRAWDYFDALFAAFAVYQAVKLSAGGKWNARGTRGTTAKPVLLHGPASTPPIIPAPVLETPVPGTWPSEPAAPSDQPR